MSASGTGNQRATIEKGNHMEPTDGDVARTGETSASDNLEDMMSAPHAVVAGAADVRQAREVIEKMENAGVPPEAIGLIGATPDEESDVPDAEAFADLAKSVTVGGAGGAVAGGVLGTLVTMVIPGIGPVVAAGLGAIFGAAVGGAAGGISQTKYASPAWLETFETVERGEVAVGVHHATESVVDDAERVMSEAGLSQMKRFDDSEGAT